MQCHVIRSGVLLATALLQVALPAQRPDLVVEPSALSRILDYGAEPIQVEFLVRSDAVSEHNVSLSLTLGSIDQDRRLSLATPAHSIDSLLGKQTSQQSQSSDDSAWRDVPADVRPSSNRVPRGLHIRSRRLLFGWGSPPLSAGHARRLRVASEIAAVDKAEVKILPSVGIGILHGGNRHTVRRLRAALPGVIGFVERDQVLRRQSSSYRFSDPLLSEQWALRAVRHQEAIEQVASRLAMRTSDIVVALIDSGVHADHPDLLGQLWQNPGEIPGNFIDDDGNGYVDDVNGWDFAGGSGDLGDLDWHGTHCAGVIAAAADNKKGILGLAAPARARVMVLKFTSSEGGLLSDAIQALEYALQNGAVISSNSFGGPTRSAAYEKALENAEKLGHIVVAAAGNEAIDVERHLQFPCAYKTTSVICVAASTKDDTLAPFSNYGRSRVDIAAPGTDILSTVLEGKYAVSSGTSMAAPHVAAALAVLKAAFPHLSLSHLRMLLLESARYAPSMSMSIGARGVLDLEAAVRTAFSVAWVRVLQSPLQLGGATRSGMLRLELGVDAATPPLPEGTHTSSFKLELWRDRDDKGLIIPVSDADLQLELIIQGTPELRFAQASLDFSRVIANSSAARKELLISNVGNGTADASVTVQGGTGVFRVLAPTQGQLLHLSPGTSAPVLIACSPKHTGSIAAKLVLTYSWPTGNAVMYASVTAVGTTPPELHTDRWSGVKMLDPLLDVSDSELLAAPAQWHRFLLTQDTPLAANVKLPPQGQQQACDQLQEGHNMQGHIALIDRGACTFFVKARTCENAGASGILVINSEDGDPVAMAMPSAVVEEEVPTISAFMISRAKGETIRNLLLAGSSVKVEMRLQPIVVTPSAAVTKGANLHAWEQVEVELRNTGGAPFTYTVASRADVFESTGAYKVQIGHHSDGVSARSTWYSLGADMEVQYFTGKDDASVFVELPAPVPFSGGLVSSGWLSLNGYLVLDPDYVPLGSYIPGWIGPEYAPRAIIAPYWDDLFCSTFCKVRVGTVSLSSASTSKDWAFVAQFENVHVLRGGSESQQTVTFQMTLFHDGTIDMLYQKWPKAALRERLVVGVEGFDVDGFSLHNYRDPTMLPWERLEPFNVQMLPWLLPTDGTAMVGELQPRAHVSLAFRLHLGLGDRQGWVTISTKDAYNSYDATRNIRIAIQTAVRFEFRLSSDHAVCGSSVVITVIAEAFDGKIANSEERNVLLVIDMPDGSRRKEAVPVSSGVGNVTLSSKADGEWNLWLKDEFNTGLDTSATASLKWVSGVARFANIDVRQVQVAGVPFRIAIVFLDQFGNVAVPTVETLGAAASATIRWRSSGGVSGATMLSLATGNYAVELEFSLPQEVEFQPEPAGETVDIVWGSAVRVTILAHDYEYVSGTWSPCNHLCGSGRRHRDVVCKRIVGDEMVSDDHCQGLLQPPEYEECSGECVRGICNATVGSTCNCLAGFEGLLCDKFKGCPSGTQAVMQGDNSLPARCEGVQCRVIEPTQNLKMEVTNSGRYPSEVHFGCMIGYTLVGAKSGKCQEDGSWTFSGSPAPTNWCRGPDANNASCTLGDHCTVTVEGRGLEPQNHLILIRGADCPTEHHVATTWLAAAFEASSTSQKYNWPPIAALSDETLMPGTYSMCWAADSGAATKYLFASIGQLIIQGPLPGNLVCMLGVPCVLEVRGIALRPTPQSFWISPGEVCTDGEARNVKPYDGWHADGPNISAVGSGLEALLVNWGVALGGDVHEHGPFGSLCWQADAEHGTVSLGQFVMQGPARHGTYPCTLGVFCALTLEGLGFSLHDVAALYTGDACTPPQAHAPQNASALLRGGGAARFEFGVMSSLPETKETGQLSVFVLCWLAGGEPGARPVAVSNVEVSGPAADLTDVACTLGVNCTIRLIGRGFAADDIVQVRPPADAGAPPCGLLDESPPLEFLGNSEFGIDQGFSVETGASLFSMGVVSNAHIGDYRMCWGSSGFNNAIIPAGSFTLHGPQFSLHGCELGEVCGVSIYGLGLTMGNLIQIRLQGACGEPLIIQRNMPDDLAGVYPAKELLEDGAVHFSLGVPLTGYVNRPHKICWQHWGESNFIDTGSLTLSASARYIKTAASRGLVVQHWVSGYCHMFALALDLNRQRHLDAVRSALADLQGVSGEHTKVEVVNSRLLQGSQQTRGPKAFQKVSLYFVTSTTEDAIARSVMEQLKDAASSELSSARYDFVTRLNDWIPDAEVESAVFDDPWLDTGVFETDSNEIKENPWGLPWWPTSRLEMFLTGFFTVGLCLLLCTCAFCFASKYFRKYTSAGRSTLISPASASPSPVPMVPNPPPVSSVLPTPHAKAHAKAHASRASDSTVYGRPARPGHSRTRTSDSLPGAATDALSAQQALTMMLAMGFQHDRASAALHRHNYQVEPAVQDLLTLNSRFVGRHG